MPHSESPHLTPGGPRLILDALAEAGAAAKLDAGTSVLYVGSRYGENALAVADRYPATVLGVDEDSEAVLYAKMQAARTGSAGRVSFRVMNPVSIDAADGSFAAAVVDGLLNAYPKEKTLAEMRRVLAPGGLLVVADSVWLQSDPPPMVRDLWETERRKPLMLEALAGVIAGAGFDITGTRDASRVLRTFYSQFTSQVSELQRSGFEGVKHQKALVKHYKHEIDVHTRHGGHKWMGYAVIRGRRADG